MKFVDQVQIEVEAGNGGDGCLSIEQLMRYVRRRARGRVGVRGRARFGVGLG